MTQTLTLRPATADDLDYVVDLKERTMRESLEALTRWDPERSRGRVVEAFGGNGVNVIECDGASVGSVAIDRRGEAWHLHLFYLEPSLQGGGLGSALLQQLLDTHTGTIELETLIGSRVRGLYERFGFALVRSEGVDDFLVLER